MSIPSTCLRWLQIMDSDVTVSAESRLNVQILFDATFNVAGLNVANIVVRADSHASLGSRFYSSSDLKDHWV